MARPLRLDPTDGWHHVMNRGVAKMAIFLDDADRFEFGRLLGVVCDRYGIEVHAYCLMGNHFHLLLHCPDANLSAFMHDLTGTYARRFNERSRRCGHVFGDRFTSRTVSSNSYLANCVRYIHRNPLDVVGVADCDTYRWSSHRAYLGLTPAPPWLHTERVLRWFDGPRGFARFVDGPTPMQQSGSRSLDAMEIVDLVVEERSSITGRRRLSQRRALGIAMSDAHRAPAILEQFDLPNPRAVRRARLRARRHFEEHQEDHELLSRIADLAGFVVPGSETRAA